MSSIPYDLLPSCDPDFAHMKLNQKQSFVNRFFGIRACDNKKDTSLAALYSHNTSRAFSSATSSTSSSYISLNPKAPSSSMRIPMATPRRPRSNTANSSTSVASFVSQSSLHSCASYSSLRSRSPSRERRGVIEDGWTPVEEYF
ncbi:hypothetical protein DPSP01_008306 [Paraphaeosphaeria sporulosa]|uniref:Uncharacterized protein n=1 Tax=Paraphaeosphaeria sporulosa TaxID=1460663 RepID=A0A177CM96_9PLEO|nr:uncharacterized protein CC84DRAFT_1214545 [Paraphaeosphaeria sporulosa]OAG07998.1 hypothetical protein CC84DRAFT_1214545 [Paraphaeosphaeria sporulosa]